MSRLIDQLNRSTLTVERLIHELAKLPMDTPVLIVQYDGRHGEFVRIGSVEMNNLENQNTSGDPEFYGKAKVVLISDRRKQ